jgi:D-arabinose 5-phosphate isomerase GutQ
MQTRKIYHVTKSATGWKSMIENAGRISVTGDNKQDVVGRTIAMAKNHTMSSVVIHKMDGTIEEERTYPRGA